MESGNLEMLQSQKEQNDIISRQAMPRASPLLAAGGITHFRGWKYRLRSYN